jgi:thiamine-monophosphate kinase
VAAARYLVVNQVASAAIDQSDGLAGDLAHVGEESGVLILLDEQLLPRDPDLRRLGDLLAADPLRWILGPSDDYELLFTVPPDRVDLAFALPSAVGIAAGPIGSVEAGPARVELQLASGERRPVTGGWDHLSRD